MKKMIFSFLAILCVSAILSPAQADIKRTFFGYTDVDKINVLEAVGSPFTRELANEYKNLANFEYHEMYDHSDGNLFARKGVEAAKGNVVAPEIIASWDLPDDHLVIMAQSRTRLMNALDNGARELHPIVAAKAQVAFDCWIEQLDENHQPDDIATCKTKFEKLITRLEQDEAHKQIMVTKQAVGTPAMPVFEDTKFVVFFDFGKTTLSDAAMDTLRSATRLIEKEKPSRVLVTGYTDTVGSKTQNLKLSEKRARRVQGKLIDLGVDPAVLKTNHQGEQNPMVGTGDNVKEVANRRVEVIFKVRGE